MILLYILLITCIILILNIYINALIFEKKILTNIDLILDTLEIMVNKGKFT